MLRIKQLREERGWSQRALALKINANPKTVNFWERGSSVPSAEFVIALADIFECTADYLLGREDDIGAVNVQRELSEDEREFLSAYSSLGKAERRELLDFANFLAGKQVKNLQS